MVDPILSKRRVDPEKLDVLRAHFEAMQERSETFERGLALESVFTEAAFLREDDDGPVLYYYMEAGDDYPPDIDVEDIDDAVLELSAEHGTVMEEVCVEPARDEDGELNRFETLFFASTLDREE